jgi:hypothetical protein
MNRAYRSGSILPAIKGKPSEKPISKLFKEQYPALTSREVVPGQTQRIAMTASILII